MNEQIPKDRQQQIKDLEPLRLRLEHESERFKNDPVFQLEVEAGQALSEGDPRRAQDLIDRAAELDGQE